MTVASPSPSTKRESCCSHMEARSGAREAPWVVRYLHVRAGHPEWGLETTQTTAGVRPSVSHSCCTARSFPGGLSVWSPQPHTAVGTLASQRGLAHLARYFYILCEALGALGEPSEGPGTSRPSTGPPSSRDGLGSPQLAGEQASLLVSWMLVKDMKCLGETKDSVLPMARAAAFCAGP